MNLIYIYMLAKKNWSLNLVEMKQNWFVIILFLLNVYQTEFCLVTNQLEMGNYNPYLVWFNKILFRIFLSIYNCLWTCLVCRCLYYYYIVLIIAGVIILIIMINNVRCLPTTNTPWRGLVWCPCRSTKLSTKVGGWFLTIRNYLI